MSEDDTTGRRRQRLEETEIIIKKTKAQHRSWLARSNASGSRHKRQAHRNAGCRLCLPDPGLRSVTEPSERAGGNARHRPRRRRALRLHMSALTAPRDADANVVWDTRFYCGGRRQEVHREWKKRGSSLQGDRDDVMGGRCFHRRTEDAPGWANADKAIRTQRKRT